MSKNKPLYKRIRKVWLINPKTRIKKSDKIYKRAREKQKFKKILSEIET